MLLIVLYHFLEVNAQDTSSPPVANEKDAVKSIAKGGKGAKS